VGYRASNEKWQGSELESAFEKTVLVCCIALLSGETEENHENVRKDEHEGRRSNVIRGRVVNTSL
jgi:hypothetical protein